MIQRSRYACRIESVTPGQLALLCPYCGERREMRIPASVGLFADLAKAFCTLHRVCGRRAEKAKRGKANA